MWRVVISGSHQRLWQLSLVAAAGPQCLPLARSQCSSMNSRSEKTCNLTPSSPLTHLIFNPRLTPVINHQPQYLRPTALIINQRIRAIIERHSCPPNNACSANYCFFSHISYHILYFNTSFILSNPLVCICLAISGVQLGLVRGNRDCHPFKGLFLRWKSMSESRWIFWLWGKGNSELFHPTIPLRHTQNLTHRSLDTRGERWV